MDSEKKSLGERWYDLRQSLYMRRCSGCDDAGFHTHHLTRLGRLRWTTPIARLNLSRVGL